MQPQASPTLVRAERRAAGLSLIVGILLLIIKFAAYAMTGSAAIFSDALESVVNVLASGFALYAVILAHRPADSDHPYGHGKIEFLAAGFEGGMIFLASLAIIWEAIKKWFSHGSVDHVENGFLLMVSAMIGNGLVGLYLFRTGRRNGSIALESDGKHLLSDAVTSAVVLSALGIIWLTGQTWIDPAAALFVAVYLIWTAMGLMRRSAAGLMDEQDRNDDATIRGILDSHMAPSGKPPCICSYHKLRHRHSGRYHWVDFHIMVPAHWSIEEGHKVASAIEYEIELALGDGNATAHVEPCHAVECPGCGKVSSLVTTPSMQEPHP